MGDFANKKNVAYKIKIYAMKDGTIQVTGPIKNLLLFRDIMNMAERAVLEQIKAQAQQNNENRIVKPGLVIPATGRN